MNGENNLFDDTNGGPGDGVEACLEVLEREAEILEELAPAQDAVARAALKREWEGFDASVNALADLSGRFEAVEAERARIFAALPGIGGGDIRFYALAARFPPEKRGELCGRYRRLKQGALRLRTANAGLLEYLAEARAAVGSFLENALPGRGGPAYSRQGTKVPQDMRSMVLNHSL
jgi:hypothetical protein